MRDLIFRTNEIPKILTIARSISTIREYPTGSTARVLQAEEIFNKLTLQLTSFKKLTTKANEAELVDISALAAISRMIIELHNALCYFCDASGSKDEIDFRIWLYNLHYSSDLLKILTKFEFSDDDSIMSTFEMAERMAVRCLEENEFFKKITEKEQKQLLLGNKAFYWRGRCPKGSPFSTKIEEGAYKLLSNYVHSFPLGNIMYSGSGPLNHLNLENSAFVIVEVCVSYSAAIILTYCGLRRKLGSRISANEKTYLKEMATERPMKEWLSQRKQIGIQNNVMLNVMKERLP